MPADQDVTGLLDDWSRGDRRALDRLLPLVYAELRRIAARQLRHEARGPHAPANRAGARGVPAAGRAAHRRLAESGALLRRRRASDAPDPGGPRPPKGRKEAGRGAQRVPLEEIAEAAPAAEIPVLALDHAFARLEQLDRGLAQIVELRAFGGLTIDEAAHVLNVSPSTAKREWRTAKAVADARAVRPSDRVVTGCGGTQASDRPMAACQAAVRSRGRTAACPNAPRSCRPQSRAMRPCAGRSKRCWPRTPRARPSRSGRWRPSRCWPSCERVQRAPCRRRPRLPA